MLARKSSWLKAAHRTFLGAKALKQLGQVRVFVVPQRGQSTSFGFGTGGGGGGGTRRLIRAAMEMVTKMIIPISRDIVRPKSAAYAN